MQGRFLMVEHSSKGITVISFPSLAGTSNQSVYSNGGTIMRGEEREDHGGEKKRGRETDCCNRQRS